MACCEDGCGEREKEIGYRLIGLTMNPYHYLFYRLSRVLNKKGNNEMGPIQAISILIGLNILVIFIKILGTAPRDLEGEYKFALGLLLVVLYISNLYSFGNKHEARRIVNRYKGESDLHRRIGGVAVLLYVVISFLLLGMTIFN